MNIPEIRFLPANQGGGATHGVKLVICRGGSSCPFSGARNYGVLMRTNSGK